MVLKTLNENLSETSDAVPAPKSSDKSETASTKDSQGSGGTHRFEKHLLLQNKSCYILEHDSYNYSCSLLTSIEIFTFMFRTKRKKGERP